MKKNTFNRMINIYLPIATFFIGICLNYLLAKHNLSWDILTTMIILSTVALSMLIIMSITSKKLLTKRKNEESNFKKVNDRIDKFSKVNNINVYSSKLSFTDSIFRDVETIEKYYNEVISSINSAQKSILIFNYIDSHPKLTYVLKELKKKDGTTYRKVHNTISSYYKALEDKLKQSEISYTRCIMLPLSYPSSIGESITVNYKLKEKTKLEDHLNEFSTNHIKEVLKLSKLHPHRINVQILTFSMVNYSFGVIDDQKVLLELDKYSISGHSLPDNVIQINDQENGHIVTSFLNMAKSYLKHSFPFRLDKDLNRSIGSIKDKEVELRENTKS